MANEKNLKPFRSENEAREKGRKGGKASGKSRREKKTTQKILSDLCESKCSSIKQMSSFIKEHGFDGNMSVHELFTIVTMLNSLSSAKLDDLSKLSELLGEEREVHSETEKTQTSLLEAIEKAVKHAN